MISQEACRVCLKSKLKDLNKSIFECADNDDLTIAEKIMMCGDIQISAEQQLPNKICKKCLNTLDIAFSFRKLCKKSETILQIAMNKKNNRNNIIISFDNGKTYTLPQDIKIKAIKTEKHENDDNEITITNSPSASPLIENEIVTNPINEQQHCINFVEVDTIRSPNIGIGPEDAEETILFNLDVTPLKDIEKESNKTGDTKKSKHIIKKKTQNSVTKKRVSARNKKPTFKGQSQTQDKLKKLIIETVEEEEEDSNKMSFMEKGNNNDDDFNMEYDDDNNSSNDDYLRLNKLEKYVNVDHDYDSNLEHNEDYIKIVHLKLKAKEEKKSTFICELCGNVYKHKCQLTLHMKRHNNEKSFPCEICGQLFLTNSLMARHLKRHTGIKPFKCQFCTRTFYEKGTCRAHERTHSGARPYVCKICDKSFVYSQGLTKHMLIHDEIKLYNCIYCNKEFRLKHHLTQHFQTLLHQEAVQKAKAV